MRAMMRNPARSRFGRDRDLARHVVRRNDAPARRVAALLGELLVLELDRRRPGALVAANGMAHVEEAAVAGVAVGDHGAPAIRAIASTRPTMSA